MLFAFKFSSSVVLVVLLLKVLLFSMTCRTVHFVIVFDINQSGHFDIFVYVILLISLLLFAS